MLYGNIHIYTIGILKDRKKGDGEMARTVWEKVKRYGI
jgi:hypothetical protein